MKNMKTILTLLILLSSIILVSAYAPNQVNFRFASQGVPIDNVAVTGYRCSNAACDTLYENFQPVTTTAAGVYNFLVIVPQQPTPAYYGVYFGAQCYAPYEQPLTAPDGQNPVLDYDIELEQLQQCNAPVIHMDLASSVARTDPITINITALLDTVTQSAYMHAGPLNAIPAEMRPYYSATTNIIFDVLDSNGVPIPGTERIEQFDIYADEVVALSFTYKPVVLGIHTARVRTNLDDECQCATQAPMPQPAEEQFNVYPVNDDICYTTMLDIDLSPGHPNVYDTVTIDLDRTSVCRTLDATNFTEVDTVFNLIVTDSSATVVDNQTIVMPPVANYQIAEPFQISFTPTQEDTYAIELTAVAQGGNCSNLLNEPRIYRNSIVVNESDYNGSISFHVTGFGAPVSGAEVRLNDVQQFTDASGDTTYTDLDPQGYTYVVNSTGYPEFSGYYTLGVDEHATINVLLGDDESPVISLVGPSPQYVEINTSYTEFGATVTDNQVDPITPTITGTVDTTTLGAYFMYYDAVDDNGNSAIQVIRVVEVIDTTDPVITLVGADPQTIEINTPYVELGATVADNSGEIIVPVVDSTDVDVMTLGWYVVTYDAMDSSGNSAAQVVRTVNVVDTIVPVINLTGANPQTLEVNTGYIELGATVTDNSFETIVPTIDWSGVNMSQLGSYSVFYNAVDSTGNPAVQVVRIVDVVDTTAPIISLVGANPQIIERLGTYVELGATVSDNYDTGLVAVPDASAVDISMVGNYPVTYNAVDSSGNNAAQVTRTVTVNDTIAPVVNISVSAITNASAIVDVVGNELFTVSVAYGDTPAVNQGNVTGVILQMSHAAPLIGLTADTVYYYQVTATDAYGNDFIQLPVDNFTTLPEPDVTPPGLTVTLGTVDAGWADVNIVTDELADALLEWSTDSLLAGASSVVDSTYLMSRTMQATPLVPNTTYYYRVTVEDPSNNTNATGILNFTTPPDTTAPVITLLGANPQYIAVNTSYVELGATVTDNVDTGLTANINSSAVITSVIGSYAVTYDAVDNAGNNAVQVIRTVEVVDTTPPSTITNLRATLVEWDRIIWEWDAPSEPTLDGYRIWLNGAPMGDINTTSFEATGLSEKTMYTINVHTYNIFGFENPTDVTHSVTTPGQFGVAFENDRTSDHLPTLRRYDQYSYKWNNIDAFEYVFKPINIQDVPFTEVEFSLNTQVTSAQLDISPISTPGSFSMLSAIDGAHIVGVYEFEHANIGENDFHSVDLMFGVENEVLNKFTNPVVTLWRLHESVWNPYSTSLQYKTLSHSFYKANPAGMSKFAITISEGNVKEVSVPVEASNLVSEPAVESTSEGVASSIASFMPGTDTMVGAVIVLVVVLLGMLFYLVLFR